MTQRYPGGFVTKTPPTLNPALGNSTPGVWTLDQVMQNIKAGTWPAYDPYFEYTTLLLHGNGTNGAQNNTFLDSSTNNFTITRNGNTTQGTFSPFSQTGWGNYFNGTSSYISAGSSSAFAFGTGIYTVEAWVYVTGSNSENNLFCNDTTNGFDLYFNYTNSTTRLEFRAGASVIAFSGVPTRNSWVHVAVVREGTGTNQTKLYFNGSLQGSGTDATNWTITGPMLIGGIVGAAYLSGYISNARIVKGVAVYTGAFTPPTSPLTAITNTSLLTCQSNRFIDNSSNAFAITVTGSPSVQRFSPFNPSAPYAAGTIGGSGYFDGSGDYLSVAANSAFACTGDFTFETWFYSLTNSGSYNLYVGTSNNLVGNYFGIKGSSYVFQANSGGEKFWTGNPTVNAWTHIALVRSGSTVTVYQNGVSLGTNTDSNTFLTSTDSIYIANYAGYYPTGYFASTRLVKGTAVYTTTFTPPTSPLTAITNTSLLLNFTNGGIIDNAMMNDLETVGNAQISTTQSKFGGSSMYFNSSNADYLSVIAGPVLGTGDFTIEFWQYVSSLPATSAPFSFGTSDTTSNCEIYIATNGTIYWYTSGEQITSASGVITTGTWQHIAVTRASGTTRLFVGGTQRGSNYTDTRNYSNGLAYIGRGYGVGGLLGYIDDFRITKGYARYTANFTPQTSQWQDQ